MRRAIAFVAIATCGCQPDLGARPSLIDRARVIAIASDPAEAKPGDVVTYTALYVGPTGELPGGSLTWATCVARKPLTELGPVSPECLGDGPSVSAIGTGTSVATTLSMDACRLFGPDTPLPKPGEPAGRPVDPDPSGGYYAPVRVSTSNGAAFGATRLACGLTSATQDEAALFGRLYHPNARPAPTLGAASGAPLETSPNGAIDLRVSWPTCGDSCGDRTCSASEDAKSCPSDCDPPIGCGGAETYVVYDPSSRTVVTTREAMRASWFATAGTFASDRTGVAADDPATSSDVGWTAPASTGDVFVWVVLRDDRGGVGWASATIAVK